MLTQALSSLSVSLSTKLLCSAPGQPLSLQKRSEIGKRETTTDLQASFLPSFLSCSSCSSCSHRMRYTGLIYAFILTPIRPLLHPRLLVNSVCYISSHFHTLRPKSARETRISAANNDVFSRKPSAPIIQTYSMPLFASESYTTSIPPSTSPILLRSTMCLGHRPPRHPLSPPSE